MDDLLLITSQIKSAIKNKYSFLKRPLFQDLGFKNPLLHQIPFQLRLRYWKDVSSPLKISPENEIQLLSTITNNQKVLIFHNHQNDASFSSFKILSMWIYNFLPTNLILFYINPALITVNETLMQTIIKQHSTNESPLDEELIRRVLSISIDDQSQIKTVILIDDTRQHDCVVSDVQYLIQGYKTFHYPTIVWCKTENVKEIITKYDIVLEHVGMNNQQLQTFLQYLFREEKTTSKDDGDSEALKLYSYLQNEKSSLLKLCRYWYFAVLVSIAYKGYKTQLSSQYDVVHKVFEIMMKSQLTLEKKNELFNRLGEQSLRYILEGKPLQLSEEMSFSSVLENFVHIIKYINTNKTSEFHFNHDIFAHYFAAKYLANYSKLTENEIGKQDILSYLQSSRKVLKLRKTFSFLQHLNNKKFLELSLICSSIISFTDNKDESMLKEVEQCKKQLCLINSKINLNLLNTLKNHFFRWMKHINFTDTILDFVEFIQSVKEFGDNKVLSLQISYEEKYKLCDGNIFKMIENVFPRLIKLRLKNICIKRVNKDLSISMWNSVQNLSLNGCEIEHFSGKIRNLICTEVEISNINLSGKTAPKSNWSLMILFIFIFLCRIAMYDLIKQS